MITIGIIGSGFMARTYAECIRKYTVGARLGAVFGGSRAMQLANDYGIACETTIEAFLNRRDLQAIIITTPEMVHKEQTILAAAAGKHILVEKPMAPTAEACDAMIASCDGAGVNLMVVQSQRFRGVNERAQRLLADGRIGSLRQMRHWLTQPLENAQAIVATRPFYFDPAGGGLFMGFAVHSFDMVRWLAGAEARSIFAQSTSYGNHGIADLSVMAQVVFENGVMAQVWLNVEMPGATFADSGFHTQLVGDVGLLDFDGYAHLDLYVNDRWERVWQQPVFDPTDPRHPVRLEAYSNMVQEFVDSIREKRKPAVSGNDGRAAVELCQAAILSARSGKPVDLPLPATT